ncbi:MAG: GNAT family N-acetyltransferase, partial [Theionarchaea archaeon]|nr:GNAT family N-acetyltransferase [Theionarchaea archaeon]
MIGSIREMERDDVQDACKLTESEEWGFDENDFNRILDLFPRGSFVAEQDGKIIGLVTTSSYDVTGWIGNVLVDAENRLGGLGSALVKRAIAHLEEKQIRSVLLYSYKGLEDFYRALGFRPLDGLAAFRGLIRATSRRTRTDVMQLNDMPDVFRLDRYSFGDDRSKLLSRLQAEFPDACHVLKSQNDVVGYSMVQFSEGLTNIGPVICIGPRCEALLFESIGLVLAGREAFLATQRGRNDALFLELGM